MPPRVIPPTPPKGTMKDFMLSRGIDYDSVIALAPKIRPDPITGRLEMGDLMQYFATHKDDPEVHRVLRSVLMGLIDFEAERQNIDSAAIDLSTIPIQQHTAWEIQMNFSGVRVPNEILPVAPDDPRSRQEGAQQLFSLYCYIKVGPGMEMGMIRQTDTYAGLPDSKQVEKFIRDCITKPIPPDEPYVPNLLVLPGKLRHHESALRPFLDSLPSPFEWFIAPQNYEERMSETHYHDAMIKFEIYLKLAEKCKEEGNKAYTSRNGKAAVDAYKEAIEYTDKALIKIDCLDSEMKTRALGAQAVYYANCSAARLLNAEHADAPGALKDAKSAIESDPHYPKGYVRLSRAYEALGNHSQAEEAIAKALRLPELENHQGLVDHLIMLQTNGDGLPNDPDTFLEWFKQVFAEGESAERMKNVDGLWRKRCEGHRKTFETLE